MANKTDTLPKGYILKSPLYSYQIEKVIGCGGFGITYLASAVIKVGNVSLKGKFAIKEHFVSSDCEREPQTSCVVYSNPAKERVENSRKDFIAEARRLQKVGVDHPNIVKVNEVFEGNNTAYYVMEYLGGESLRSLVLGNGQMSESEMFALMNPIINAVRYLHKNRMTHLDIKPDNIMVVQGDDGGIRPVLIDFGLSKHYDKDGKPTSTINILGCSDGYAPIEQYAGVTNFSPAVDIYAVGATMWFCLVGKNPKKATDIMPGDWIDTLPSNVSDNLKRIISNFTNTDKTERSFECLAEEADLGNKAPVENDNAAGKEKNKTNIITPNRTSINKNKIWGIIGIGVVLVTVICIIAFMRISGKQSPTSAEQSSMQVIDSVTEMHDSDEDLSVSVNNNADNMTSNVVSAIEVSENSSAADESLKSMQGKSPAKMYSEGKKMMDAGNCEEGWRLVLTAAKAGNARAQDEAGSMYSNGHIDPNDEFVGYSKHYNEENQRKGFQWWRKAAEQNIGHSQLMIGDAYLDGLADFPRDTLQAVRYYKKAKVNGCNRWATQALGKIPAKYK